MPERILVIDDEEHLLKLIDKVLTKAGYTVVTASNGEEGVKLFHQTAPDLVVLDIMMPGMDGREVCRRLRQTSSVPIVFLTALDSEKNVVDGLMGGADDYLTKPFNPRELVARVKAVLRRYEKSAASTKPIHLGQVTIDPQRREVTVGGQQADLRTKEFDLLWALAEHQGIVLSRDQLLDLVWGYDYYGETRTVDVHIARLRDRLEGSDVVIETVWGIGYKLVVG